MCGNDEAISSLLHRFSSIKFLLAFELKNRKIVKEQIASDWGDYPILAMTLEFLFLFQIFSHQTGDLTRFCVAVEFQLRENQLVVNGELKATTIGRDQGDRFDIWLKLVEQLSYQTGSSIGVMSDCAVDQVKL